MPEQFMGDPLAELPTGFAMQLAKNPGAMAKFGRLSDSEKTAMIANIQSAGTGEEAKEKIIRAVRQLG